MTKGTRAGQQMKQTRNRLGKTQEQMAIDLPYSRESLGKMEKGERKIQPEMARCFLEKHNNPWVGFEASAEYVPWGPLKLDGDIVDLHRSSVKEKAIEEFEEMIETLKSINTVNHPSSLSNFEKEDIKRGLLEVAEGMTAGMNLISVFCENYAINWVNVWKEHHQELKAKRYARS